MHAVLLPDDMTGGAAGFRGHSHSKSEKFGLVATICGGAHNGGANTREVGHSGHAAATGAGAMRRAAAAAALCCLRPARRCAGGL